MSRGREEPAGGNPGGCAKVWQSNDLVACGVEVENIGRIRVNDRDGGRSRAEGRGGTERVGGGKRGNRGRRGKACCHRGPGTGMGASRHAPKN